MKKSIALVALLGTTMLATPAFALYWPPPPTVDPGSCTNLCDPDLTDISQNLLGFQTALNTIVDIDDAVNVVQKAVNAGNLVTFDATTDIELGTIIQSANVNQTAANLIDGKASSKFYDLSQAATNVVNSVSGNTAVNITQTALNSQRATNTIYGGSGGYDADALNLDDLGDAVTQTAVNASNLVSIEELNNKINQSSTQSQTAINTAAFESEWKVEWTWHGPKHVEMPADIYDFAQSATNVTNSVSVGDIALGYCACDFEVTQYANAGQFAENLLRTAGDIDTIAQSATNVANSIAGKVAAGE